MGTPFSPSIMSGNFDFPPAIAGNEPTWDNTRPTTIDPWATHANYSHPRGAVSYDLNRRAHYGRSFRDGPAGRPYTHVQSSTRRHHHEDQAAATQHFPTSAVRPHASTARIRRSFPGRTRSPYQSPMHSTLPQIRSPDFNMEEYSGLGSFSSRSKRRRLDVSDRPARNFCYDWKGRCVPGRLNMELRFCDGGLHADAAAQDRTYTEQNILVNDQSVYCTHKNKCNLILQHMDEVCFTLNKLVIKAPSHGFTSPIQEGMIFVGMDAEELTRGTARYRLRSQTVPDVEDVYDETSIIAYDYRPVSRRRDTMSRNVPPPVSDAISRREPRSALSAEGPSAIGRPSVDSRLDWSTYGISSLAGQGLTVDPRLVQMKDQGFLVTSHCDPPSDDEEEESSPQTLFDRQQRENMPEHFLSTSDEDAEHAGTFGARRPGLSPHQFRARRRGKRRSLPLGFEVSGSSGDKDGAGDALPPHAKFFIEREKSVVTLNFDPPVAGKFILFKLWSLSDDQNIDIQSIVVHGFAGPRTFPAMGFR